MLASVHTREDLLNRELELLILLVCAMLPESEQPVTVQCWLPEPVPVILLSFVDDKLMPV